MPQINCRKVLRIGVAGPVCITALMLGGCFAHHDSTRSRHDHAYYAPAEGDERSIFINPVGHVDRSIATRLGRLDVAPTRVLSETDLAARTRSTLTQPNWPPLPLPAAPKYVPQSAPQSVPPNIPLSGPGATPPGTTSKDPAKPIQNRTPARPAAPGVTTAVQPAAPVITDPVVGIVPRLPDPRVGTPSTPAAPAASAPKL